MGACFEVILKMSLTASFVIAAVFLIRLLLVRAPRKYSYLLWLVVLIRLLCPAALETRFGAVPDMTRLFAEDRAEEEQGADEEILYAGRTTDGQQVWDGATEERVQIIEVQRTVDLGTASVPDGYESWELYLEKTMHTGETQEDAALTPNTGRTPVSAKNVVGIVWLCGCLIFFGYGMAGYLRVVFRLHRKEKQPIRMEEDVCTKQAGAQETLRHGHVRLVEDFGIGAPFTVGIFRPVICLPKRLLPFQREMVLAHEKMHIRRKDNLLKMLAYAARCIHWFNPLVWLAFRWFEEDMETSCDEAVLESLGYERRKDYAKTLLALSGCQKEIDSLYSVSFGRKNAKERIRNVLSVKKARLWVVLASGVVVIVSAAMLLANHKPADDQTMSDPQAQQDVQNGDTEDGLPAEGDRQQGLSDQHETEVQGLSDQHETRAQELPDQWDVEQQELWAQQLAEQLAEQAQQMAEQEEFLDLRHQEIIDNNAWDTRTLAEKREDEAIEEIAVMIADGTLSEGNVYLENSMGFVPYGETDQAVTVITVDGVCGLLCNPQTGCQGNVVRVEYFCPIVDWKEGGVWMSAGYGCRCHPVNGEVLFHSGIDFSAAEGTPVYAAEEGCVYRTGFDAENGNYVILIHGNGELTYYAHCESIIVQAGDIIDRGEQIATVGSTGKSSGAHLHFAVSRRGMFILPQLADVKVTFPDESVQVIPVGSPVE